jgi:hypothetical protein
MSVDPSAAKGGFTSTYLNRYQMAASAKAIEDSGMRPFDWVKAVLLKELIALGHLPQTEMDMHLLKVERKKETPHGNSKEARAQRAQAQEVEPSAQVRKPLTLAERREARRSRRRSIHIE